MAKNPNCWTILSLSGKKLDPEKITDLTGISPDFFSEQIVDRKDNGLWQIYSRLEGRHDPEDFIWDILKRIAPVKNTFKKLSKEFDAVLYCSLEFSDPETNGALFSSRVLLILGDLGVKLELHPWKHES